MNPAHLIYFKELVEGNAATCWVHWFQENETDLKECMTRPTFLRLKFKKVDEAIKILQENEISFTPSIHLPQIKQRSQYVIEALERNGELKKNYWRKCYSNAFGLFEDGKTDECTKKFVRYLKAACRKDVENLDTDLSDFACDSRAEFRHGNRSLGLLMLKMLANFKSDDDIVQHYICEAKTVLLDNEKSE